MNFTFFNIKHCFTDTPVPTQEGKFAKRTKKLG